MSHPNFDVLIALEDAAPGAAWREVVHLVSCAECQSALATFDALAGYRRGVEPPSEFADTVLASVARRSPGTSRIGAGLLSIWLRPAGRIDWTVAAAFGLATLSAWIVLVAGAWTRTGGLSDAAGGAPSLGLALVAGAVASTYLVRLTPLTNASPSGVQS